MMDIITIMSLKTVYIISIGEPQPGTQTVVADEFVETLIYVGRLIERFIEDENMKGKYIHVEQFALSEMENKYIKQNNLFSGKYLIGDDCIE